MRATRLGTLLLALGLVVGLLAGVGLLLGFEPARLPAALLNVAAYKLTFLAAFGLLAAGAVVRRYARRGAAPAAAGRPDERPRLEAPHEIPEPRAEGRRQERAHAEPGDPERRR